MEQDYVYREIIEVLPDIYGSIEQILSQLRNNEIRSVKSIDYIYHPITRKVYINWAQKCRLDFNNLDVGYCLGYNPDEVLLAAKHHTPQNIANLRLYQNCYIYTDIVQNQLMGDVKAPFLRVVPVKDENMTYIHYDRPHFLHISRNNISVVEVNIRNGRGNPLSFQSGTSIITLLFRRKPARFFSE